MARATGTSEVLAINLTNVFVVLALAIAIIFGFAFVGDDGASARSHDGAGGLVSVTSKASLTGGMCFLMYTNGDEEKLGCIQRSACEDPKTAVDYLSAAKYWWKMHKLMKIVPFSDVYKNVLDGLEEATNHSLAGGDCAQYKW